MKLLQSQSNELFKLIQSSHLLHPSQFSFSNQGLRADSSVLVRHNASEYNFRIFEDDRYVNVFNVNYTPGENVYKEIFSNLDWSGIVHCFNKWLLNISKEIVEPNYWERLESNTQSVNLSYSSDNSKFTIREFEDLKLKMNILSERLDSIPINHEQLTQIKGQLDRITDIAKDLGKYDWINLFIGTIIAIVIQLNVTPDNARLLWELIKTTFNALFLN